MSLQGISFALASLSGLLFSYIRIISVWVTCSLRDLWLMDLREMPTEWQVVRRRKRKKSRAPPKKGR